MVFSKEQTLGPGVVFLIPMLVAVSTAVSLVALGGMEVVGLLAILAALGGAIIFLRPDLGMLVFLASFLVTYGKYIPTEGRFTPNNVLALLLFVLLLLKVYRERDLWFLKERTIHLYFFLFIYVLISSGVAESRLGNPIPELDLTSEMLQNLATRFAFLILFINFIRTYRDIKHVLWTLIGLILISAVSGVQEGGLGEAREDFRAAAGFGIAAGGNPNRLAFFCVSGIALLWYYRQTIRSKLLRLIVAMMIPGLAVATLMTGSRSGLVTLVVLFVLLTMAGRFNIKRQIQMVFLIALAGYLASNVVPSVQVERLENLVPGSSSGAKGTSSLSNRVETLRAGLEVFLRDPLFGTGIGNFRWVHFQMSGVTTPSHNSYLWAAAEGGIPTLLLYLMVFGLTLRNFIQVEKRASHPDLRATARGLRTSFLVFLVFSFFADFWLNIFSYVLVGLGIVLKRLLEGERQGNNTGFEPRARSQVAPA